MTEFKEHREKGQFYRKDNSEWIKTDENHINSLWHNWVAITGTLRYYDEDGFLVFSYKKY